MATATLVRDVDTSGNLRVSVTNVVFSSSYTTGGEAVTPAQLGLNGVYHAITSLTTAGAGGVADAYYNVTTGKILAFGTTGEIANTTNLSAWTAQIVAWGY